jgi:hypothetical protein
MTKLSPIGILFLVAALWACGGDDDGAGGPLACGDATCAEGQVCCDHCTGSCVPEGSGAFCPDDQDPDHDCTQGGIEEGMGEPFSDGSRCTCPEGVCVNQNGGPGEPVGLHCGSWRPADCDEADPCPCVVEEGECTLDSSVLGLCQCDNGLD